MIFENLIIKLVAKVAVIAIDRPKNLNVLNRATIRELHRAFKMLDENIEVRAIILTGKGEKAFVAGADIKEFADYDVEEGTEMAREGHRMLFDFIEQLQTPVIAAINGYALGGGLELAMACHLRVAGEHAKMGLPEVSLGMIPGYGGTQRLPKLIGKTHAMEMILTGKMISAQKAYQLKLINQVVAHEELMQYCLNLANTIAKNSSQAIAKAIKAVNASDAHLVNGYSVEIENFGLCFDSEDLDEGIEAFLEKRAPKFD